jgi:hypothetical protein
MEDKKLPDLNLTVKYEREYNLGGYRNAQKFSYEISGSAEEMKKIEDVKDLIDKVSITMANTAKSLRKRTKEKVADDGKIIDEKVE